MSDRRAETSTVQSRNGRPINSQQDVNHVQIVNGSGGLAEIVAASELVFESAGLSSPDDTAATMDTVVEGFDLKFWNDTSLKEKYRIDAAIEGLIYDDIRKEAFQYLMKHLKSDNPGFVPRRMVKYLASPKYSGVVSELYSILFLSSPLLRTEVTAALVESGLKDEETLSGASGVLLGIDPNLETTKYLIEIMNNENDHQRKAAAAIISHYGCTSTTMQPLLDTFLKNRHTNGATRYNAEQIIVGFGEDALEYLTVVNTSQRPHKYDRVGIRRMITKIQQKIPCGTYR